MMAKLRKFKNEVVAEKIGLAHHASINKTVEDVGVFNLFDVFDGYEREKYSWIKLRPTKVLENDI